MKEKPKCEKCEAEGKEYGVQEPYGGVTTCMAIQPGYWDEDGTYHSPYNPNKTTLTYSCTNGHSWHVTV